MSMITEKEFEIWKFIHLETEKVVNVYFLPNNNLKSREDFKKEKLRELYYDYALLGVFKVSKEYYLNSRLEDDLVEYLQLTTDYDSRDFEDCEYGPIEEEGLKTLIRDKHRAIYRKVRRIMREGLQVHNEMALDLYDSYHFTIEEVIDSLREVQDDECIPSDLRDYYNTIANSLEKVLEGDIQTLMSMKEHIRRQKFTCIDEVISFYSDLKVAYDTLKDLRKNL